MAPTRDLHARLAEAKAKAQQQREKQTKRLRRLATAERKLVKEERTARQMKWGRILDHLGLLDLDDAALQHVLTVAYRLVQDGRVRRAASETEAEVEQLIADRATLVLVGDDGQPLEAGDGTAHPPESDGVSPLG